MSIMIRYLLTDFARTIRFRLTALALDYRRLYCDYVDTAGRSKVFIVGNQSTELRCSANLHMLPGIW